MQQSLILFSFTKKIIHTDDSLILIKIQLCQMSYMPIPNPGVPCSKPPGGSKFDSSFHCLRLIQWVYTGNFWEISFLEMAQALRKLNPTHKKGSESFFCFFVLKSINPFHASGLFWYPLKASENLWFSDVFRGYQKRTVAWNGLTTWPIVIMLLKID